MTIKTPTAAEIQEREYENSIAHRYNRDYHDSPIMAEHSRAFADFVARCVKPGDRVLDLGCGAASLWGLWHERLPKLGSLVGIDLSPGMLEMARALFPNGDFREGSFVELPSGPGEFDVVIVSSAFHHISDALLPVCLQEVHRVLDEHGVLIGREPLMTCRLGDRGGWVAGALMHLRHLIYRLTHTREYPEPAPGPDHHAYEPEQFLGHVSKVFAICDVEFRNPASPFLARSQDSSVAKIAKYLDEEIRHREGQELHYAARKNFSTVADVHHCVQQALAQNHISNEELAEYLPKVAAAAQVIESLLEKQQDIPPGGNYRGRLSDRSPQEPQR